jgi:hypothetical protein
MSTTIYVDADACPVKEEIYRVAQRFEFAVVLVANVWMRTPDSPLIDLVVVSDGFDAADDHIVEQALPNDIVVTDDIPLASRSVAKGARALNHKGKIFTAESIGDTLATRDLLTTLRSGGQITGGPAPFRQVDRSNFLQALDRLCREVQRA